MGSREDVPLKEYVDALLAERDLRHDLRERFMEKAVDTALVSINQRLGLLNELRQGVATKEQLEALSQRFDEIKATLDAIGGGAKAQWKFWAVLIASVTMGGVLLSIAGFILAHSGVGP